MALLRFLRPRVGRVTWERVLSGPGLHNVFTYLVEGEGWTPAPAVRARLASEDPSAVIGELGVAGGCPVCEEAVDLFVCLYGSQAGNLGLSALAVGGVYVGGGIVTKLLPKITGGRFVQAFHDKEPHESLMRRMPLSVILTAQGVAARRRLRRRRDATERAPRQRLAGRRPRRAASPTLWPMYVHEITAFATDFYALDDDGRLAAGPDRRLDRAGDAAGQPARRRVAAPIRDSRFSARYVIAQRRTGGRASPASASTPFRFMPDDADVILASSSGPPAARQRRRRAR